MDANDDSEFRIILAHHEAGHAVVAWTLGERATRLWLDGLRGGAKDTLPSRRIDPEMMSKTDWTWVKRKSMILLGGEMAERRLNPESNAFASIEDREETRELIKHAFGNTGTIATNWITCLEDEVMTLIMENWATVSALANALMAKGCLSDSEVEKVLAPQHAPNR